MIKPNRKNKKKYEFHPIAASKQDLSSGPQEQQTTHQTCSVLHKLNSSSSKTRQQITSLLANATVFPKQLSDKLVLKQLLIRVVDDSIPIAYNAVFAINNLIRNDESYLKLFYELNVMETIVAMLKRVPGIENMKVTKRVIEGVYLLIETILTTLSLQQLKYLEGTESMQFLCTFALDALANLPFLQGSEIVFEVLAYLSEYSQLRNYIGQSTVLETLFSTVSDPAIKALLCATLTFSKPELSEKLIVDISDFVNESIDDINLEKEYNQNILKHQKENEGNEKEEELNMEVEMNEGDEGDFEDVEEEKVLEVEEGKEGKPIVSEAFLNSIDVLEVTSNLILSLVEDAGEEVEEEEGENEKNLEEEQVIVNLQNRNKLKQRLSCVTGIVRNASLTFPQTQVLVEQSWAIIRNSLPAFNPQTLLQLSLSTLHNILSNKLPFNPDLLLSVTENSLQIIYKLWKQSPHLIKIPTPILLHLTSYNVLQKATPKIVVLLLDLVSMKYNPEEQPVTQQQNATIGGNLKEFLVKSSNVELQCQCFDTLFSVYSNEDFDVNFKGLGLLELLREGLAALNGIKGGKKFVRLVKKDLERFVEYKTDMLKKQKLI